MKRVIVETPYAGDVKANVAYARKCIHDCLLRGEAPYASHLLYTQDGILDDTNPTERALGINAGFVWGDASDLVAVYTDRGISWGMILGIVAAQKRGTPIEYRTLNVPLSTPSTGAYQPVAIK